MNRYHGYSFYQNFTRNLRLNLFHATEGAHDYDMIHTFPFNVLSLCLESEGNDARYTHMDSGKVFEPLPGNIFFVPSYTRVHYFSRMTHHFISFHFNLTFLSGIDLFRGVQMPFLLKDPVLFTEFSALFRTPGESLSKAMLLESLILKTCASLLPPEMDEKQLDAEIRYRDIFKFISEHLNASLTVAWTAKFAGCAPDTFSHRFSTDLGISPKQYIQKELIDKISVELLRPDASIKEIAELFQFSSAFYLSSFFKKLTGMSPSEYRKRFSGSNISF